MNDITWGGVLTTASDVLFSGGKEGYFFALDARTGDLLWKVRARRAGQQRADDLLGQRQAVRHRRRGQFALRVRATAVAAGVSRPVNVRLKADATGALRFRRIRRLPRRPTTRRRRGRCPA